LVYEEWADGAAFDTYLTSEYFKDAGAILHTMMDGSLDSAYYQSERMRPQRAGHESTNWALKDSYPRPAGCCGLSAVLSGNRRSPVSIRRPELLTTDKVTVTVTGGV
jgi:hypothetical protein